MLAAKSRPTSSPSGRSIAQTLDLVAEQQVDQRADAVLVMAELLGREQRSVLVGDVNVVPVAGPVDPADCAHRSSSRSRVRLKNADQEVPWRVLIGRPSVGRRPCCRSGCLTPPGGACLIGPSERQASRALSRWWSAMCAESQASPNQRSSEISLSRKENENNLTTQQPKVVR